MSVDSFIQHRISIDNPSAGLSSASATPTTTTRPVGGTTPATHSSNQSVQSRSSSSHQRPKMSTSTSRGSEPAVDPRWDMDIGNDAARREFLQSIRVELPPDDRITVQAGTSGHPAATAGTNAVNHSAPDSSGSGGGSGKRQSIIRSRTKFSGTTSSKSPSGATSSAASGAGGMHLNASSSTIASTSTGGGSYSYGDGVSNGVGGNRAASTSISSTRRPAVSSAGNSFTPATNNSNPHIVSTSFPSSSASASTTPTQPTISQRRASTGRQRTYSHGAASAGNGAMSIGQLPGQGALDGAIVPPVPPPSLRIATTGEQMAGHSRNGTNEAPPLQHSNSEDSSEYCIALIGAKGCGKTTLVKKIVKLYSVRSVKRYLVGDSHIPSTLVDVDIAKAPTQPVRILEVEDSLVSHPDGLWPSELPSLDGVLLCYDASNEDSFTRIPELLAGYHERGVACVMLACKSDLHRVVSPGRASEMGKPLTIGLVEVSSISDDGKSKARDCFVWMVKSVGRHRRVAAGTPVPHNPASPAVLQAAKNPWDRRFKDPGTPTQAQVPPTSSSQSSLVHLPMRYGGNSHNGSAPVLPLLDTLAGSSNMSHSTDATGPPTLSGPSASVPSTARTSLDSVVFAGGSTSPTHTTNQSTHLQQQPLLASLSSGARSASDLGSKNSSSSAIPTPSPSPHVPPALDRTTNQTSITATATAGGEAHEALSPQTDNPPSAGPAGAGSSGVDAAEASRQRDASSLQWATLDEILDKLLFVSVSGDDPVFIQHFFLTYRRFATPRSVLLGMQKRMIELGKETRDPLLAKFAQMRICNLLSQWKENYPTDFGAPGTLGALQALLRQVVTNVHLVHYASDLIPFLDEVPKLVDRESTWCKKDDTVILDDSEDEEDPSDDDVPAMNPNDPADTYVGKGESKTRTPASSNPQAPPKALVAADGRAAERPYHAVGSSSAPNVATSTVTGPSTSAPSASFVPPPMPSSIRHDHETFLTYDLPVNRSTRVALRDLQYVADQITKLETVHVAQEITRRMLILFKKIEARDWLRRTLSKKDYDKERDPIGQLTRMFNYLVCWVSALIASHTKVRDRAKIIDKLVVIAKALRQHNNYMGMNAFIAGINNVRGGDDEELTQVLVSKPNWKQFKSLQVLVGTTRSGATYRTALKHTPGAAIPDLERHSSDILRADEGNDDFSKNDPNLIHWGKFTIIGRFVGTITLYQNRCHTMADYRDLEERPYIGDLVFKQVVWDHETLTTREHRAWEEAQTTESSTGLRRLLPFRV